MAHLVCGLKGSICVFSNLNVKLECINLHLLRTFFAMWGSFDWSQYFLVISFKKRINRILCLRKISPCRLHVPFKKKHYQILSSEIIIFHTFFRNIKLPLYVENIKPEVCQLFKGFMGINLTEFLLVFNIQFSFKIFSFDLLEINILFLNINLKVFYLILLK